jgi:tetratricopeptide (TPR) repeat protein
LKVLEIYKRSYGENHAEYARILENLSDVLRYLGEYEEARNGYIKTLVIYKRNCNEDHSNYARILGILARYK